MGHNIHGFVARTSTLEQIALGYQNAKVVTLQQGFGFLPLTDSFRQEVHAPEGEPRGKQYWSDEDLLREFHEITDKLTNLGGAASHLSPVAYIETEYFGGDGVQGAIVWNRGEVLLGPLFSEDIGPIDQVLHELGVQVGTARDEFDALGLGKHRDNDAWLEETAS